jgi:chemotaxis response regulator CheB
MTTRVVIADDLDDLRWLLRNQLELDGDFIVVGEAANGVQAVEAVAATNPDVVVLDLQRPKMTGLDGREIRLWEWGKRTSKRSSFSR